MRGSNQNRKFNQPYWTGCVCVWGESGRGCGFCISVCLCCTRLAYPWQAVHPASASVSSGRFIKVHWNCAPSDRQFVLGIHILVGGEWQCPWRWRRHSLKFSQLVLLANAIKQHWAVKRVTIQTKCHKSHRVTVAHSERESAELFPVVAFCAALAQHNWFIIWLRRLRDITAPPQHHNTHAHPAYLSLFLPLAGANEKSICHIWLIIILYALLSIQTRQQHEHILRFLEELTLETGSLYTLY